MLFRKKERIKRRYTIWRTIDTLFCFGVLSMGSIISMLFPYFEVFWVASIPALILIELSGAWYDKDIPRSRTFRRVTGILRAVIYTVVIAAAVFPFVLQAHAWKWAYPIQRAMYLSHYQDGSIVETLLPEKLPEQTEQYEIRMVPSMMQGAGGIDICYYTDTATVKAYRQKAQSICEVSYVCTDKVVHTDEVQEQNETASRDTTGTTELSGGRQWFYHMEEKGASQADMQGAEVYVLGKGSQNTAVWMLNPETGYFRIYW